MSLIEGYNKKGYLLPDDIHSMANYHAKLYPVDKDGKCTYQFRIADCYHTICLRGELKTKEDYEKAVEKLMTLSASLVSFATHIHQQKLKL